MPAPDVAERILHVVHPTRRRDVELPGHLVQVRTGPGPVAGDQPYLHDGLFMSSQARAMVDNARESHARGGRPARTLTRGELEDWIDQLAATYTPQRLGRIRRQVEDVAEILGDRELGQVVSELIGAASGTRREAKVRFPRSAGTT